MSIVAARNGGLSCRGAPSTPAPAPSTGDGTPGSAAPGAQHGPHVVHRNRSAGPQWRSRNGFEGVTVDHLHGQQQTPVFRTGQPIFHRPPPTPPPPPAARAPPPAPP